MNNEWGEGYGGVSSKVGGICHILGARLMKGCFPAPVGQGQEW